MKSILNILIYILISLGILLTGCSSNQHDDILLNINRIVDVNPDSAKRILAKVKTENFNERDQHYFDFLTVKVDDKNCISHKSDSLIMSYVNYAEKEESHIFIDEAYYYAGRVYSDLNDYPDAIKFFHKALDNLPADSLNSNLHCRILSQTGGLLAKMRLQTEAVKYLRELDAIIRQRNDTVNTVLNLHLLRHIYLCLNNIDSARICASEALALSPKGNMHLTSKSKMLLAEVFYMAGMNDTALKLVRHAPEMVKPVSRNAALSISAKIYQAAGISDTAWMYVHRLISSKDTLNQHRGYRLIFSTSMADRLQDDSLRVYLVKYHDILDAYYNRNNAEEAVLQHTVYNYSQHERARSEAEREQAIAELKSHQRLAWVIVFASATIILLLTSIMFYEMQRRRRSELEVARNKVIQIEETMNRYDVETHQRQELIVILRQSYEKGLRTPLVGSMRDSCVYRELKRRLEAGSLMNDSDPYWKEMESMISEVFPKFKETLICLTGDNLSLLDWHVAILIKCRISQSDMARLLGVGRSAITHRLSSLSKKVFGNEANSRMITGAILLIS